MQRYIVIVFLMMQHLILRNSFKQFFRDHRFTMVNFAKKASPSSSSSSSSSELKKKKASPSISKMNVTEAKLELEYLSSQLTRHNELYYNLNAPEISDASYDKLKRRAEDILGRFGDLRSLFPQFESVGGSASNHFAPYAHSQPMLSLDNAFTKVEIGKFLERLSKLTRGGHDANIDVTFDDVIVEPKIDGLSLSIEYVDGILRRAGTRGDGQNGEDVTQNLDLIVDLPTRIRNIEESVRYMEVRGEVFMSRNDFLALNDAQVLANQTSFANCRNAAAGSLRRVLSSSSISSNTTSLRRLNFFAYALLAKSVEENTYLPVDISQSELLPKLETMGFNTAQPAMHVTNKDSSEAMLESVWDSCQHLLSLRTNLPYDIDGAVIKANSASDRRIVGDGRRSPKWALAYKFPEDEQTTQLLSVTIQVGRTGLLTPVANLSPVSIGGVVIERATLHNEDEVNRLGLADFLMNGGDPVRVLVKRAGDVIPKIVRTLAPVDAERSGSLRYMLPDRCPVCNSPTEREESTVGVRCTGGLICSAQVVEKLSHFCSRNALSIEGLGPAKLEELHRIGLVSSPVDIFRLRLMDLDSITVHNESSSGEPGTLRERHGWGDRSVGKMLTSIDERRQVEFRRFLIGLGVRHVGEETARDVAAAFVSFETLWKYLLNLHGVICHSMDRDFDVNVDKAYLSAALDLLILTEKKILQSKKKKAPSESTENLPGIKLLEIPRIGTKAVISLMELVADTRSRNMVEQLLEEVYVIDMETNEPATSPANQNISSTGVISKSVPDQLLLGKRVAFTGKLSSMTRSQAESVCDLLGGRSADTVTKQTNILVVAAEAEESGSSSTKATKAKALGVEVWSEQRWVDLVKNFI